MSWALPYIYSKDFSEDIKSTVIAWSPQCTVWFVQARYAVRSPHRRTAWFLDVFAVWCSRERLMRSQAPSSPAAAAEPTRQRLRCHQFGVKWGAIRVFLLTIFCVGTWGDSFWLIVQPLRLNKCLYKCARKEWFDLFHPSPTTGSLSQNWCICWGGSWLPERLTGLNEHVTKLQRWHLSDCWKWELVKTEDVYANKLRSSLVNHGGSMQTRGKQRKSLFVCLFVCFFGCLGSLHFEVSRCAPQSPSITMSCWAFSEFDSGSVCPYQDLAHWHVYGWTNCYHLRCHQSL